MGATVEKLVLLIIAIYEGFETHPIISESIPLDRNKFRFCKGSS
jgi:hypothetical protein